MHLANCLFNLNHVLSLPPASQDAEEKKLLGPWSWLRHLVAELERLNESAEEAFENQKRIKAFLRGDAASLLTKFTASVPLPVDLDVIARGKWRDFRKLLALYKQYYPQAFTAAIPEQNNQCVLDLLTQAEKTDEFVVLWDELEPFILSDVRILLSGLPTMMQWVIAHGSADLQQIYFAKLASFRLEQGIEETPNNYWRKILFGNEISLGFLGALELGVSPALLDEDGWNLLQNFLRFIPLENSGQLLAVVQRYIPDALRQEWCQSQPTIQLGFNVFQRVIDLCKDGINEGSLSQITEMIEVLVSSQQLTRLDDFVLKGLLHFRAGEKYSQQERDNIFIGVINVFINFLTGRNAGVWRASIDTPLVLRVLIATIKRLVEEGSRFLVSEEVTRKYALEILGLFDSQASEHVRQEQAAWLKGVRRRSILSPQLLPQAPVFDFSQPASAEEALSTAAAKMDTTDELPAAASAEEEASLASADMDTADDSLAAVKSDEDDEREVKPSKSTRRSTQKRVIASDSSDSEFEEEMQLSQTPVSRASQASVAPRNTARKRRRSSSSSKAAALASPKSPSMSAKQRTVFFAEAAHFFRKVTLSFEEVIGLLEDYFSENVAAKQTASEHLCDRFLLPVSGKSAKRKKPNAGEWVANHIVAILDSVLGAPGIDQVRQQWLWGKVKETGVAKHWDNFYKGKRPLHASGNRNPSLLAYATAVYELANLMPLSREKIDGFAEASYLKCWSAAYKLFKHYQEKGLIVFEEFGEVVDAAFWARSYAEAYIEALKYHYASKGRAMIDVPADILVEVSACLANIGAAFPALLVPQIKTQLIEPEGKNEDVAHRAYSQDMQTFTVAKHALARKLCGEVVDCLAVKNSLDQMSAFMPGSFLLTKIVEILDMQIRWDVYDIHRISFLAKNQHGFITEFNGHSERLESVWCLPACYFGLLAAQMTLTDFCQLPDAKTYAPVCFMQDQTCFAESLAGLEAKLCSKQGNSLLCSMMEVVLLRDQVLLVPFYGVQLSGQIDKMLAKPSVQAALTAYHTPQAPLAPLSFPGILHPPAMAAAPAAQTDLQYSA